MSEPTANIWFPFMIGDHLGRTNGLTHTEESVYIRLQCYQWQKGHFRADQIPIIGRLDSDAWSMIRASFMQMVSMDDAGLFFLPWLEDLKTEWSEKHRKAVEKAKKAANARWAKKRRETGEQEAKPMLGALHKQSPSNTPDGATAMPFTFTSSKNLPPSQAQGDPRSAGEGGRKAKTPKRPAVASEAPEATQPPSTASGAAVEPQRGTQSVSSAHPVVQIAEARTPTSGDSRFRPFKGVLMKWWGQANEKPAAGAPWGGRTDAELKRMLQAEPGLSIDDLVDRLSHRWSAMQICLEHPKRKGAVLAVAPLDQVMRRLATFADGPVTELGDPL